MNTIHRYSGKLTVWSGFSPGAYNVLLEATMSSTTLLLEIWKLEMTIELRIFLKPETPMLVKLSDTQKIYSYVLAKELVFKN